MMDFKEFGDAWAKYMEEGNIEEEIDDVFKMLKGVEKQLKKTPDDYIKELAEEYFEHWTSPEVILDDLDVFIDETNDIILGLGNGGFFA